MNITCIICSDLISATADIYTTQCGHLFHYHCLVQWIERSKTCPQCRNKSTEKTIHKVYFNVANTDHVVDDVATLQYKLDNLQFQIGLKDKDVKNLSDKYRKVKSQNIGLREEVAELEKNVRGHDSMIHALKDQIAFFKSKSKERDKLADELHKLKCKVREMESVQLVITGTREQVNDMLRNETDKESLVILAATLKKALIDAEKKKSTMDQKYKQLLSDNTKYRREVTTLELTNQELRNEIELSKQSWSQEKDSLKTMVLNMQHKPLSKDTPTIKRIMLESPVPLAQRSELHSKASPSVEENVNNILESGSPYLPVKSNSLEIGPTWKNAKFVSNSPNSSKISIFNKPLKKLDTKNMHKTTGVVYNGLGGQSKEELFPSPRLMGIKRALPGSSISSAKMIKLTPPFARKR